MKVLNLFVKNNDYKKLDDLCKEIDSSFTLSKIKFQVQSGGLELIESSEEPDKSLKGFLYNNSNIVDYEKVDDVWVRCDCEGMIASVVISY